LPSSHRLLHALYKASKQSKQYFLTLKMATEMFAETLGNFQHSMLHVTKSKLYIFPLAFASNFFIAVIN
jgi:hypothetical protein